MKLLPYKFLVITAAFCTLSCGSIDYEKRYPNMVANVEPISAGIIEVQFDNFLSTKLVKSEVEVFFYPRFNAAVLEFRYEFVRHRQFWDEDNRKYFAQALEHYKTDYAARNLLDRYRRTSAIYGKVRGRLEWEVFSLTKTRVANPNIEIGYRFREKMPYFATNMRSAGEEIPKGENIPREESAQINMYFTRAQADELVKLFDQDFLMRLLGGVHIPKYGEQGGDPDLDPYNEPEAEAY